MKWWRLSGLLMVSVSLSACSGFNGFDRSYFTQKAVPLNYQVQSASAMVIETGGNDIILVPATSSRLAIKVLTNRADPPAITFQRKQTTLTVHVDGSVLLKPKSRVQIEVPANLLQLTIKGNGSVRTQALPSSLQQLILDGNRLALLRGSHVKLQRLSVDHVKQAQIDGVESTQLLASVRDSGPVAIHGNVGIRELVVTNSDTVAISWVNSQELTLRLRGTQRVYFAGIAQLLNATVLDHARLDAKYLRAQKAFVNTKQHGTAEVTVLDSLNAYAQDQSNIYYYTTPKLLGRYYQDHGSILFMGEKPPPCLAPECAPMPNRLPG